MGRDTLNKKDIELLLMLDQTKNITHAAEQLFVSQSTISMRITNLEKLYGIAIIIRKHRGIEWTDKGKLLLQFAQRFKLEHLKLLDQISEDAEVSGTLNIGVSHFFALHKMPKILRLFKKEYPNVHIEIITGWSSEMYRELTVGNVHLIFVKGDFPWGDEKLLLYKEAMIVASAVPFELEDLPNLPRIDYKTDPLIKHTIDQWWNHTFTEQAKTAIFVNQVETCKEMILNGLGFGILSEFVIKNEPSIYSKPIIHPETNQHIIRPTWLYYEKTYSELKSVHVFIQFIKKLNIESL